MMAAALPALSPFPFPLTAATCRGARDEFAW